MAFVALFVSLLALVFTVASFWWLHARRGSLVASKPQAYAFTKLVRLRLPFALFNTGARALIVEDLRLAIIQPQRSPLQWFTTRRSLRPEPEDGHAFATPFAIQGRSTREVIVEFGDNEAWEPASGERHLLRVEARILGVAEWVAVVTFEWWSPVAEAETGRYLVYPNQPSPQAGPSP
jgi:hypothetical protein